MDNDRPDLPPMPELPPEGSPDHPLSHVAPGDDLRELIHELRNARQAIELAERVFVRRSEIVANFSTKKELAAARRSSTRRFGLVIVLLIALVVVGTVAFLGYRSQRHEVQVQERSLRHSEYVNCLARNAETQRQLQQAADGQVFLRQYLAIISHSEDQRTAQQVAALLQRAERNSQAEQPPAAPPDCSRFLPH